MTHVRPPETCRTCQYWSAWLPNHGDCLAYALKRLDAMLIDEDSATFAERWPKRSARETAGADTCEQWETRE